MKNELKNYKDHIIAKYNAWNHNDEMAERFAKSVGENVGRKYIKVVSNRSVHSFIVISPNDKNFAYGDILKAASWNAPARNFARGNIFDAESYSNISWTGA